MNLPGVAADANYQLQVEDALSVSRFKRVVFVDAARAIEAPFEMTEIEPLAEFAFTTHSLAPHTVLALSRELYRKTPTAFLLAIRGYDFGLGEGLSGRAERNLEAALGHLAEFIRPGTAATRRKRARPRTRKNL